MLKQNYQNLSVNSYTFQLMVGILYKDQNGVRLTQIDIEKLQTFTEKSQAFSFETEISIDEQIFNINEGIDMKREIMNPISNLYIYKQTVLQIKKFRTKMIGSSN